MGAWSSWSAFVLFASGLLGCVVAGQTEDEGLGFRGVAPEDIAQYQDPSAFQCPGGGPILSRALVNDDFCDCPKGGDEPGTGACTGSEHNSPKGFYCPNHGLAPRYVYLSRVGDGVCDCCDGSDEWQTGACSDTCDEFLRAKKARLEQQRHAMETGIAMKRKALEASGTPEIWAARVEELKTTMPKLQAEVSDLQARFSTAEEIFLTAEQSRAQQSQQEQSGGEGNTIPDGNPEERKVSEYAKWMEKESTGSAGDANVNSDPGIRRVVVKHKTLQQIKIRSGDMVDFVDFHYTNGDILTTGGGKGNAQEPFLLEPGEAIVEIRGGQGGLLDRIQFVTSNGRSSQSYGGQGGDAFTFKSEPGMMIVGLERSDGTASKIAAVQECPLVDPRSDEERARDDARAAFDVANHQLSGVLSEISDLEARLAGDFKQDTRDAYSLFDEKCASGGVDQYTYKICIFGRAQQDHTNLGTWEGWDPKAKNVALFQNGERCFSGITRSARVKVECGGSMQVLRVFEPSQCKYEATMTHPAACEVDSPDETGGSSVRVLQAHEVHDEL